MKKFLVIMLLLAGFTVSLISTPINTAGSLDDIPEPHSPPPVQNDWM